MRYLAIAVLALLAVAPPDDPAKDLKSRDPLVRLAAVEALATGEHEKAERLLVGALDDDDWEVQERAARALAERGGEKALKPLVELALEGPVRSVRRAAAESLAAIDPAEALEALGKKVGGRDGIHACEAIADVGRASGATAEIKGLDRRLRSKELDEALAAARALAATVEPAERAERLAELLAHERLSVRAAALEAIARAPRTDDLPLLLEVLRREGLSDVLERRALGTVRALVAAAPAGERVELAARALDGEGSSGSAELAARHARLCGVLGTWSPEGAPGGDAGADGRAGADAPPWAGTSLVDPARALAALEPALAFEDDAGPRAAAARALAALGTEEALARLRTLATDDRSGRVRWIALDALAARSGAAAERALLVARLSADGDPLVRERAAVALGAKGLEGVTSALATATTDVDWRVAVAALVSLGKTRAEDAVEVLAQRAREAEDWRLRGAAAYGLVHAKSKAAVPPLIECLGDERPEVRAVAHHHLKAVSRLDHPAEVEPWRAWWAEQQGSVRLVDPKEEEELREKYGYAARPASEIYAGMDLVVLQSRGDHIEHLLEAEGIGHRLTEAARVPDAALHPAAIFVANCTGEIEDGDLAVLEWFVHAGGYLFGSCWALTETIERIRPGVLRKTATQGEVLDNVPAQVCAPDSPYVEEVFGTDVVPIYALQGAHLIEIVDPERVELLVDSPVCAERWGSGNLAAWFRVGHGVILDSVNHFDVQGLELATHLGDAEERQAYAIDHMGLDWETWRDTRDERFWGSALKASQEIRDLSVFRLVTNFVRLRRLAGL